MPETVDIPLADLLIDPQNARLKDEQSSQQQAILALAKQQGARLLKLAKDIVDHGMDPITLPAVIATGDQKTRYLVLEGNRRIVALKALETPSLISPALDLVAQRQLKKLAEKFANHPVDQIKCVLFPSEEDARPWITLRHTGQNEGVGLVEWGADEKDRFFARHGNRSPAGMILDFVEQHGNLSQAAKDSNKDVFTNLDRLIKTPEVRNHLGIEIANGEVLSRYPIQEVVKGLTRIVEDLKTEQIKVNDIYYAKDRVDYIKSLPEDTFPDPTTQLTVAKPLNSIVAETSDSSSTPQPPKPSQKPRASQKRVPERTALVPKNCRLTIANPRINTIYNELLSLSTDQFPNACAVLLRVFMELSVDHYIDEHNLMPESTRMSTPLVRRIKEVSDHLLTNNKIGVELHRAIELIAESRFVISASTITFNQYVHNKYVLPRANELRIAWDQIQPFMEQIWA